VLSPIAMKYKESLLFSPFSHHVKTLSGRMKAQIDIEIQLPMAFAVPINIPKAIMKHADRLLHRIFRQSYIAVINTRF
jgi:hypothetical protein